MTQNIHARDVNHLSFINPTGLYDPAPNGYSEVAVFPADWRMIFSGRTGRRNRGPGPFGRLSHSTQTSLAKYQTVLAAAGAKTSEVAKFTLYVVDHSKRSSDHGKSSAGCGATGSPRGR